MYQLATKRSTFALISDQPAWFASGDCDNERICCLWVWSERTCSKKFEFHHWFWYVSYLARKVFYQLRTMFFLTNFLYYFDLFYNNRKRRIYRQIVRPTPQLADIYWHALVTKRSVFSCSRELGNVASDRVSCIIKWLHLPLRCTVILQWISKQCIKIFDLFGKLNIYAIQGCN